MRRRSLMGRSLLARVERVAQQQPTKVPIARLRSRGGAVAPTICQIAPADRWLSDAGLLKTEWPHRPPVSGPRPLVSSGQPHEEASRANKSESMAHRKHLGHSVHADDGLRARGRDPVTSGSPRASRTEAVRTPPDPRGLGFGEPAGSKPGCRLFEPYRQPRQCGRCLLGFCLSRWRMRKQLQRFMLCIRHCISASMPAVSRPPELPGCASGYTVPTGASVRQKKRGCATRVIHTQSSRPRTNNEYCAG